MRCLGDFNAVGDKGVFEEACRTRRFNKVGHGKNVLGMVRLCNEEEDK